MKLMAPRNYGDASTTPSGININIPTWLLVVLATVYLAPKILDAVKKKGS